MGSSGTPRRTVRQREIAALAGVSVSTVSRVLSGANGISVGAQRRVLAAAADLGHLGEGRGRRPRHVSLLVPEPFAGYSHDPFNSGILAGVEAECRRQGVHLGYALIGPDPAGSAFLREKTAVHQIDGLLLLSVDDPRLIEQVLALGLPTVAINAEHPSLPIDAFLPNNEVGPMLAVRHLVAYGHRRILHVSHLQRPTLRRRYDAYRASLATAGIAADPALLLEVRMDEAGAYAAMGAALAERRPDYTAVFCANDLSAIGVMRALQAGGYRVPEDVSVLGYDDIPIAPFLSPPLTTVRIEREELGALAVRRLLDRAATPTLTPIRVELAVRLVERRSVARRSPEGEGRAAP